MVPLVLSLTWSSTHILVRLLKQLSIQLAEDSLLAAMSAMPVLFYRVLLLSPVL
jgi:hypothetical protein